ncbi:MAG: MFS transporter [Candidatus Woesearchaeota archaeon]
MELTKEEAIKIIIFLGIISLLGDLIYESSVSINGQYFKLLNANAIILGIVFGVASFLGYILRLLSGFLSDKTKAYFLFAMFGYGSMIFIPLLCLVIDWRLAAFFIVFERIGKAFRAPAKDTLLSFASKKIGTGLGFGISEVLDQIGALIGPLLMSVFFTFFVTDFSIKSYQKAYSLLFIPYVFLMIVLLLVYFSLNLKVEKKTIEKTKIEDHSSKKLFLLYSFFMFFTTFGLISFSLVGYHLKKNAIFPDNTIPLLYAVAMIIDAVFAIILGKLYDKAMEKSKNRAFFSLFTLPFLTILLFLLLFSNNILFIWMGIFILGLILSYHETISKAIISDITLESKRGFAFGFYNFLYGFALLLGSLLIGYIYESFYGFLILFVLITQIASLIILIFFFKELNLKYNKIKN